MLAEILSSLPEKPPACPVPKECLAFLKRQQIPIDIIDDLQASSYEDWIQIGPLCLLPMRELVQQNMDSLSACIENGLLVLASGANGDPVALDRRTRKMLFVSHDTLWEEDFEDFAECLQPSPYIYEDFWKAAVETDNFPWDYFEARRQWNDDDSIKLRLYEG